MAKSNYLKNAILNQVLRATSFAAPVQVYLALYTTAPTDAANSGVEVAGVGYARQPVIFAAPTATGQVSNTSEHLFSALSDWGTVLAFALLDSPTGGNVLYHAPVAVPRLVLTNDTYDVRAGQLVVLEG